MRRVTAIAVAALGLAVAPAAQASTTIGQLFTPTASTTATVAQTGVTSGQGYTVPADGVITSWSFLADSAGGQVKLKAVRPIDGGQYAVVGESELQTVAASQQQTFASRVPVNAGDLLGTTAAAGKSVAYTGAQGDTVVLTPGDQPPGSTGGFSNVQGIRVDVTAVIEADADRDGYGDETQDACSTDPTLQTRCTSNLSMRVSADKRVLNAGSMVTFGLTVHNAGPSTASGVQVVAELSPELELVGTEPGTCSGGPTVTCSIGNVPRDADAVLRVVAKGKSVGPATIAARAGSTTADPDQSDNGTGMSIAVVGAGACGADSAVSARLQGDEVIARLAAGDCLIGGDGVDQLTGGNEGDTIAGRGGNDRLFGGKGNDSVAGETGNDEVFGESGNDKLTGGDGSDTMSGGTGNDNANGGTGSDSISGGAGNDSITGGTGNDRITGGTGVDRISAGSGKDRINVRDRKRDIVNCGSGVDTVTADSTDRLKGCEHSRVK